jgi:hypothetical protein
MEAGTQVSRVTPPGSRAPTATAMTRFADVVQRNVFVIIALAAAGTLQTLLSRGSIIADAWYTLLGGRIVSRSGLPHHDALTVFAQGREWVDQQWLGHLLLYGLWAAGGWPLTILSIVAMYGGAFVIAAVCARQLGASERSVSLVAPACFIAALPNTVLRAQIPAYVLFALVVLLVLADERRPSRRLLIVFPLLVLWANVHGSVVFGAGLVALRGATLAVSMIRMRSPVGNWAPRAALLLLGPWACVLVSPYAGSLPGYYHRTLGNSSFSHLVSEWAPSTVRGDPVFFALLLIALWLLFRHGRTLGPCAQLALILSGIGGLLAVRNIVWFVLVAAAVLPIALDAWWPPQPAARHKRLNLALAGGAVFVLLVAATATATQSRDWVAHDFPAPAGNAVAAAARADTTLKVFANERYADWLLFDHPVLDGRIAYDVRFELLTAHQLQAIYDFDYQQGPQWRRAATGYRLLVLDPRSQEAVIRFYVHRLHARTLYRDGHIVVLRDETPSGR